MKRLFILILIASCLRLQSYAEEGMWIPMLIEQLNIKRMQELGFKLSAEDLYSVNRSSLKDAIVQFGGGCTAEFVSPQGLLLTNHHCGLGAIQKLSSLQHDYITNGFWSQSNDAELPCPGLTVTLLVRIEDVTGQVLAGIDDGANQVARAQNIRQNIEKIEKQAAAEGRYEAKVRPFFYGNQYYLFVNEIFKDIRLAGAPPSSIGKFGGDTDNWMWPRHTGDFSIFRVYADKENNPASYSKDNVPYRPKYYLPLSLKGYQKDDFTFVFGYPGTTREYLTSYGVALVVRGENPVRIRLRQERLDIINMAMEGSRLTRIQYTSKAAGIANFWKKMIGESKGIDRLNAIGRKQTEEAAFQVWAGSTAVNHQRYGGLLDTFKETYRTYQPVDLSAIYYTEAAQGIEAVRFAAAFRVLLKTGQTKTPSGEAVSKAINGLTSFSRDFFRNYDRAIDADVMETMLKEIAVNMDRQYLPEIFLTDKFLRKSDFAGFTSNLFEKSLILDSAKLSGMLRNYNQGIAKSLEKDPLIVLMMSIYGTLENSVQPLAIKFNNRLDSLQRLYMEGLMKMNPGKVFYPDANSTLRVAFGKIDDFSPADAVSYKWYTTLTGVMEKADTSIYDYKVDENLRKLYHQKDFGRYGDPDGTVHVAFTASNHTTGGNSGSPVLNAGGELIGINFDRNWEGTMSDLMYDPALCRNIALDIRYCLFVIDKVAGCPRLVSEMKIVD